MSGPARDGVWLAGLGGRLARAGFLLAGGFAVRAGDDLPPLPDGRLAASVLLVGSLSNALIPILKARPEWRDGEGEPLDRYTRSVLGELAAQEALGVVFPFDGPPFHPFQTWTLRLGGFSASPVGVLAHAGFGPWLGLRAALLCADVVIPATPPGEGPCPGCADKPCVSACPAGALSVSGGYDVPRCLAWLGEHPQASCHEGCVARHACPAGTRHRQSAEAGRFHMKAFTSAARARAGGTK